MSNLLFVHKEELQQLVLKQTDLFASLLMHMCVCRHALQQSTEIRSGAFLTEGVARLKPAAKLREGASPYMKMNLWKKVCQKENKQFLMIWCPYIANPVPNLDHKIIEHKGWNGFSEHLVQCYA